MVSEQEVQQLVEMGATAAQARIALRRCRDFADAAELVFSGALDGVEDEPMAEASASASSGRKAARMVTPEDDEPDPADDDDDDAAMDEDDDDEDAYVDYDSDYETRQETARQGASNADPYAGIFFSKDRKEEVIEVVEDEPEQVWVSSLGQSLPIMSQGEWMKGCPEGGEQSFLFSLYNLLSNEKCACPQGCGYSVQRKKSDFFTIYPDFARYIESLRKVVAHRCPSCTSEFCLACGDPIARDKVHRPSAASDNNPLFHCSNLQGVILGVGLSMLEHSYAESHLVSASTSEAKEGKERAKKKRKLENEGTPDAEDEEDYYGSGPKGKKAKGGIGYAGAVKEDMSGHLEALAAQKIKDQKIGGMLKEIRVYLPSLRRQGGGQTSDYLPHPTALAHLRRRFNHVSSALLRNDSLSDMSDRSVLYFELFEWLETISNHESLASMMAMPCMVVTSVKPVKKPARGGKSSTRERNVTYEGSSGPRELLEAVVIQAQAAIKGLEGFKEPEKGPDEMTEEEKRMNVEDIKGKAKETDVQSEENSKLLRFCERILATAAAIDRSLRQTKGDAFVQRLHASLPRIPSSSAEEKAAPVGNASEEEVKRSYVDWATRVRFEYCDLTLEGAASETITFKHAYNGEARMLANADLPKRSLAIAKELAVLTTNLPVAWDSSVFLRVDETRVDVIKALITGPEGTPYYNGCYCFDIFLGSSYNQTPPQVKYMTTNNGKYRFNPNLYADGKVCLSLLGTWSGPGWIAGKSTLLQVLISIQSMILCEEPYLNEPGWASQSGTPASAAYSANVRRMVVNTAMLGQLKNPPDVFADVIRTHFRLKAKSIVQQLDKWVAMDDGRSTVGDGGNSAPGGNGGGSNAQFLKDIEELKKLIAAL